MTREEAIAIAHGDPDVIVDILLRMGRTIEELRSKVEELERKIALLTRDSSNSSKPPSSDGPAGKPKARPPLKSKKRRPGGQPGHKGSNRDLIPSEEVDEVITVLPEACDHCGAVLTPDPDADPPTGKYWRHQVIDIPDPKPVVAEYQLQCLRCSCGAETWAKIPQTARSGFGPRLTALLAHLTGLHRMTRRGCQEIAKTIFGIDISLGSVCKLHQEVSESLERSHEAARQALPEQPVLNIDETGWKTQGEGRWLWVFVTPVVAFFHVAESRGAKVLKEILGDQYTGVLCSDMYSAYKAFHTGVRQFCWAHIIRGIKGIRHACRSPDAVKFSKWMLSETGRMFGLWHAFKDGHLDRETLVRKSVPIRSRMSKCLQQYRTSSDSDVRKAAKSLLKHWNGLFTFLEYEGVEPTNNSAERSCILQGKNPFQFLLDSVVAHRRGLPGPPLV
jgi:transposase